MDPEVKKTWLVELRNPANQQGRGKLRSRNGRKCCLGLLCDVVNSDGWVAHPGRGDKYWSHGEYWTWSSPDDETRRDAGISDREVDRLIQFNDTLKWSFLQIADYVEENL